MPDFPSDFLPDLRRLDSHPDLEESLWRHPGLVEQTYGMLYQEIRSHLHPPLDVLDLGCGTGYVALELAREGCRVLGIDADAESVDLAERARHGDPKLNESGLLSYRVADVQVWDTPPNSFDVVVASRVLHHIPRPEDTLDKVGRWLRPDGRLVCVEFAYDRFDQTNALWLYQLRSLLQLTGFLPHEESFSGEPKHAIARISEEWWHEHEQEEELNTSEQLLTALEGAFTREHFTWLPYIYWEILENLDGTPDAVTTIARFLKRFEEYLIDNNEIPALLFSWVGQRGQRGFQ